MSLKMGSGIRRAMAAQEAAARQPASPAPQEEDPEAWAEGQISLSRVCEDGMQYRLLGLRYKPGPNGYEIEKRVNPGKWERHLLLEDASIFEAERIFKKCYRGG